MVLMLKSGSYSTYTKVRGTYINTHYVCWGLILTYTKVRGKLEVLNFTPRTPDDPDTPEISTGDLGKEYNLNLIQENMTMSQNFLI